MSSDVPQDFGCVHCLVRRDRMVALERYRPNLMYTVRAVAAVHQHYPIQRIPRVAGILGQGVFSAPDRLCRQAARVDPKNGAGSLSVFWLVVRNPGVP